MERKRTMNVAITEMSVVFFLFGGSLLLGGLTLRLKAISFFRKC